VRGRRRRDWELNDRHACKPEAHRGCTPGRPPFWCQQLLRWGSLNSASPLRASHIPTALLHQLQFSSWRDRQLLLLLLCMSIVLHPVFSRQLLLLLLPHERFPNRPSCKTRSRFIANSRRLPIAYLHWSKSNTGTMTILLS
jgi:hypothetical protein